jgi:hypothetical protein
VTDLERRRIKSYLTGYVPASLRGETIEQPTDFAIQEYVTELSAREQSMISRGPFAATFSATVNAALRRIHENQIRNRPLANGGVATGFLDFAKHEVRNIDVSPLRFKDDEE